MGDAFIVRRGGGGLSKCSIIVHIETGSTVGAYSNSSATTLVKAGKELGTSGDYLITGLNTGTYYVKATKGTKSRIGRVVLSAESVAYLNWTYDVPLYDYGDENTVVTGGWIGVKSNILGGSNKPASITLDKYADYMYFAVVGSSSTGTNYIGGYITTENYIDLSKFSQVHLVCTTNWTRTCKLAVLNSSQNTVLAQTTLARHTNVDTTLDISSISQLGYIAISIECDTGDRNIPSISLVELKV